MERGIAERLVKAASQIDKILGGLDCVSNEIDDEMERSKIRTAIAMMIIDLHERVTLEVVKDFPDLHPDAEQLA